MVVALLLLSLVACENQYVVEDADDLAGAGDGADTADTDTATDEDYSEFDGARLVITSPASGDFLAYEEDHTFAAEVQDADGNVLDFDDVTWASDIHDDWALLGANVDDDSLDVGTHALTAEALLPNGDRLAYTIGGVLVQSTYTGVYTGTISVNATAEYDGTAYSAGCGGAITLVVDAYGEVITGDAGCLISLLGYELDTAYVFDLENDDGDISGVAALDLSFYQLDIEATGAIDEDGALGLAFATDVYGFVQLDATVEATRVSRDISEYE
jgi:hypothetical protein